MFTLHTYNTCTLWKYPAIKDYMLFGSFFLSFLNMPTGLSNTCKLNPPKIFIRTDDADIQDRFNFIIFTFLSLSRYLSTYSISIMFNHHSVNVYRRSELSLCTPGPFQNSGHPRRFTRRILAIINFIKYMRRLQ